MDHAKIFTTLLPVATLVAATVAGWYLRSPQLRSDRPEGSVPQLNQASGTQVLEARLWQDPFQPLQEVRAKAMSANPPDWRMQLAKVRNELAVSDGRVCVAVAFLSNSRTVDDAERRQRTRLAMMAGLGQRNYVPEDSHRIGWLMLPWSPAPKASREWSSRSMERGDEKRPLLASFEWLTPAHHAAFVEKRDYARVLLLWVDEADFGDRPFARLAQLAHALGRGPTAARNFDLKLFGPRTSSGMFAMCDEAPLPGSGVPNWSRPPALTPCAAGDGCAGEAGAMRMADIWKVLQHLEVYSTWATVADAFLPPYATKEIRLLQDEERGRPALKTILAGQGAEFHHLTCTDDQLMNALHKEMRLRHVPSSARDSVLLFSEWHTDYGRALPLTFAAQYRHNAVKTAEKCDEERTFAVADSGEAPTSEELRRAQAFPRHFFDANLMKVSYLSGVDGGGQAAEKNDEGKGAKAQSSMATIMLSNYRPEGDNQLDYLERLTASIESTIGHARPAAIGILGSDVYDKLILLQALRTRYQDAFFFTTDLDARLAQPRLATWTRNLLVASSYGLDPIGGAGAPRGIMPAERDAFTLPPFRDSYQTALHWGVKLAFGRRHPGARGADDAGEIALAKAQDKEALTPRVFEIGRTEAVKLEPVRQPEASSHANLLRGGNAIVVGGMMALVLGLMFSGLVKPADPNREGRGKRLRERIVQVRVKSAAKAPTLSGFLRRNPYWPEGVAVVLALVVFNLRGWDNAVMPVGLALAAILAFRPRGTGAIPWKHVGIGAGLLALLGGLAVWLYYKDGGIVEPMRWIEGVSVWPAELVRLVAALLGFFWLWKFVRGLETTVGKLTKDFHLQQKEDGSTKRIRGKESLGARTVWAGFRGRVERRQLMRRCGGWTCAMFLLWVYFIAVQERAPIPPTRGELAGFVDITTLAAAVGAFAFLTVVVMDVTMHAYRMIREVAKMPTAWPEELLQSEETRLGLKRDYLDGWLDVQFVGQLTDFVGRFVIYPLVLLFLIIVATHPLVDRWDIVRPDLIVLLAVCGLAPIVCGWFLCRAAEKAREEAVEPLSMAAIAARKESAQESAQIDALATLMRSYRHGAFKSFWEQPYILALLIPLGGTGGLGLLERLLG